MWQDKGKDMRGGYLINETILEALCDVDTNVLFLCPLEYLYHEVLCCLYAKDDR